MPETDLERRVKEDFSLLVLAHAKGDPAMYQLLRDRTLHDDLERARRGGDPVEVEMAERD